MPRYKQCKSCEHWTLNVEGEVCENPECQSTKLQLASELSVPDGPRSPESQVDNLIPKTDTPGSAQKIRPELQLKQVVRATATVVGVAGLAWWVLRNTKRGGNVRTRSTIPYSARTFATELVASGKSYPAIVEANNPLSRELTDADVQEIADAVAEEVLKKLKSDRDFRHIVREEATALKRTLPSNMLASAIVNGISIALGFPISGV